MPVTTVLEKKQSAASTAAKSTAVKAAAKKPTTTKTTTTKKTTTKAAPATSVAEVKQSVKDWEKKVVEPAIKSAAKPSYQNKTLTQQEFIKSPIVEHWDSYDSYLKDNQAKKQFYSMPEFGKEAERLAAITTVFGKEAERQNNNLMTVQQRAQQLGTKLQGIESEIMTRQAMGEDVTELWNTYRQTNTQYQSAQRMTQAVAAGAGEALKRYQDSQTAAKKYMEAEQKGYENWKSSIRMDESSIQNDREKVNAEIQSLTQRLKSVQAQREQYFTGSRNPEKLRQVLPNATALQQQETQIQQRIRALQNRAKLLDEESYWQKHFSYENLKDNADFAKRSEYKSKENGETQKSMVTSDTGVTGYMYTDTGFDDPLYDYINGNEKARTRIEQNDILNGRMVAGVDKSFLKQMTAEEVQTYNYLYALDNAVKDKEHKRANEYLNYLQSDLTARDREARNQKLTDYAEEHPVGATALSLGMAPMKGISFGGQILDKLDDGQIDQNAAYNKFAEAPNVLRQKVEQNISEKHGKTWGFLYDTGMSVADNLVRMVISGGAINAGSEATKIAERLIDGIMASGAAADTVRESMDRGLNSNQALTLGTLAGVIEIITEKHGLENLLEGKWEKNYIQNVLKQMLTEGSEEVASDMLNTVADLMISKDKAEWITEMDALQQANKKMTRGEAFREVAKQQAMNTGLSFLGGAISGGVLGGGKAVIDAAGNRRTQTDTGNMLRMGGDESIREMLQIGAVSNDANIRQMAENIQKKMQTGTVSDRELGDYVQKLAASGAALTQQKNENPANNAANEPPIVNAKGVENYSDEEIGSSIMKEEMQMQAIVDELKKFGTDTMLYQQAANMDKTNAAEVGRLFKRMVQVTNATTEEERQKVLYLLSDEEAAKLKAAKNETQRTGILYHVKQENIDMAERIGNITGRKIVFFYEAPGEYGDTNDGIYTYDGLIHVNARTENPMAQIIGHELTHSIEETEYYKSLQNLTLRNMDKNGELQTIRRGLTELYKRNGVEMQPEDQNKEITAWYMQHYLLTDEAAIRETVQENRGFGVWMHDKLDGLLAKMGNKNAQERVFVRKARNLYAKALQQSGQISLPTAETTQQTTQPTAQTTQQTTQPTAQTTGQERTQQDDVPFTFGELPTAEQIDMNGEYSVKQLGEMLEKGEITEQQYDKMFDRAYDAEEDLAGRYSISRANDRKRIADDLRDMLKNGASTSQIRRYVNTLDRDTERDNGVQRIQQEAKDEGLSVIDYVSQNWDLFDEGSWRQDAREAVKQERASYSISPGKQLSENDKKKLKTIQNNMVQELGDALSVPKSAQRTLMRQHVEDMTEEYFSKGEISQETRDAAFEDAYENGVIVQDDYYNQYKDLKKHLRTQKVTIADEDKSNIPDYNAFRKRAFGTLNIVNKGGLPVDEAYQELIEMAPELFPEDITHPADRLMKMAEVANGIRIAEKSLNDYYGTQAEQFKALAKNDFYAMIDQYITLELHPFASMNQNTSQSEEPKWRTPEEWKAESSEQESSNRQSEDWQPYQNQGLQKQEIVPESLPENVRVQESEDWQPYQNPMDRTKEKRAENYKQSEEYLAKMRKWVSKYLTKEDGQAIKDILSGKKKLEDLDAKKYHVTQIRDMVRALQENQDAANEFYRTDITGNPWQEQLTETIELPKYNEESANWQPLQQQQNVRNMEFGEKMEPEEAKEAPAEIMTAEDAKTAYKNLKETRKKLEKLKVLTKNQLNDNDRMMIGQILRGENELQNLDPKKYHVGAIAEMVQAQKAYDAVAKTVLKWKNKKRAENLQLADTLLDNAGTWKDKSMGILYDRETAERNIRDIVRNRKESQTIIDTLFTPVHKSEAESKKFKDAYRDRVNGLKLSSKVKRGNKVSEAHAVQLLGEAQDNIEALRYSGQDVKRDGKTAKEWQDIIDTMKAENKNLNWDKIEKAVGEFHKIYNELFERINQVRVDNGYEPINYRRGYFPHFQPGAQDGFFAKVGKALQINMNVDTLPTTISGLTHTFKPGITWFGHGMERTGFTTEYDAVQGFDKYIEGAADVIFQTDNIQRLRAFATQVRYRTSDEGLRKQIDKVRANEKLTEDEKNTQISAIFEDGKYELAHFVEWLDEYTNQLANKKSKYDRTMEAMMGRKMYDFCKKWEQRVGANMVSANLSSALTNFIPWTQAWSRVHSGYMLQGMWKTLQAYAKDDGFVDGSAFLTNRRGSDPIVKTWANKVSEVLSAPMEFIDTFTADTIVRARYLQNIKRGMSEQAAMDDADAFAMGIMADRSKGSQPVLFGAKNPIFKGFTQFQLEVNNQWSELFKDLPEYGRERGAAALAVAILKYLVGAFLYNEVYEAVVGRRAALDPLGIINDTVGDLSGWELPNLAETAVGLMRGEQPDFTTEKTSVPKAAMNLANNVAEELPFNSIIGLVDEDFEGGRIPVSQSIPNIKNIAEAFDVEATGKYRWSKISKELIKLSYVLPPFGGNQARKVWQGVKALKEGGSYTIDKEGNKQMQYPVYTDSKREAIGNAVRVALFGKSSLPTARDWVENGFDTITAKKTTAYLDMVNAGVKGKDAFSLIKQLGKTDKTETESKERLQRRMIMESEISDEGKSIVYYALMAGEKEQGLMDRLDDLGADAGTILQAVDGLYGVSKKEDKIKHILSLDLDNKEFDEMIGYINDYEEETEKGNRTKYGEYLDAVKDGMDRREALKLQEKKIDLADFQKRDLTEEQYLKLKKEEKLKTYDDYVKKGLRKELAYDLAFKLSQLEPEKDEKRVDTVVRWKTALSISNDLAEQNKLMEMAMTKDEYARMQIAEKFDVTPAIWVAFYDELGKYDADGNGYYKNIEIQNAVNGLAGSGIQLPGAGSVNLTNAQKATLWQMITSSKGNKNPYDTRIGSQVYDARHEK